MSGSRDPEFIAGLKELVDEAIDGLQMHIHFRKDTALPDAVSRELAENYIDWALDNLRQAQDWAARFAKPS